MTISQLRAALAILAILTLAAPAEAGWLNASLREMGLLWGDGYHARSQCPPQPKAAIWLPALPALPTPWGAFGAAEEKQIVPPSQMARPTLPPNSLR